MRCVPAVNAQVAAPDLRLPRQSIGWECNSGYIQRWRTENSANRADSTSSTRSFSLFQPTGKLRFVVLLEKNHKGEDRRKYAEENCGSRHAVSERNLPQQHP